MQRTQGGSGPQAIPNRPSFKERFEELAKRARRLAEGEKAEGGERM